MTRGDPSVSEKLLLEAIKVTSARPKSTEHASALNQLGVLYDSLGRPGAETLLRQALAIRQEVLGPQHIETGIVLSNIGHALDSQHRYGEAEQAMRQAFKVCTSNLEKSPRCFTMLNNLASVEQRTGRIAEAENDWKQAIEGFGVDPSGNINGLTAAMNNLGKLYLGQRRFREAQQLFDNALAILDSWPAYSSSPDKASVLTNLGALYIDQKKLPEAEDYMRRAIDVDQKAVGADSWRLALDYSNLGVVLGQRKQFQEAEETFQRSEEIYRRAQGPRSPEVAHQLANMGEMNAHLKQYALAAERFNTAFEIWGDKTGLAPPIEINLLQLYSFVLKQTQDFAGAEKAASRAMTLKVRTTLHPQALLPSK
jgi:tetratricopeptide (TPR) repeat protein